MESKPICIDDMPNEILMAIITHLPNKLDWIRLERVSKRWQFLSLKSWAQVKVLNFNSSLNPNDSETKIQDLELLHLRAIFWRCGEYLSSITMSAFGREMLPPRAIFTLINKYCKNLTTLNLAYSTLSYEDLHFLSKEVIKKIKVLNLNCAQLMGQHEPFFKSWLKKAINLNELHMNGYFGLFGDSLLSLSKTLKLLSIKSWLFMSSVSPILMKEILNRLPQLESLAVSDDSISPESLSTVCSQLKVLKMLKMRTFYNDFLYNNLSFPKLKKLSLVFSLFEGDFLSFLSRKCPLLEELELYGSVGTDLHVFKNFKSESLVSLHMSTAQLDTLEYIASNCRKLKEIECSNCTNITETVLNSLFELLPQLETFIIGFTPHKQVVQLIEVANKSVQLRMNNIPLNIKLSTNKKISLKKNASDTSNRNIKIINEDNHDVNKVFRMRLATLIRYYVNIKISKKMDDTI